jgi:hypothetical protein
MPTTAVDTTAFAHNTDFSGIDKNVPVVAKRYGIPDEQIDQWHEASATEVEIYEYYWNLYYDLQDESASESEADSNLSHAITLLKQRIAEREAKAAKEAAEAARPLKAAQRRAVAEVEEFFSIGTYGTIKALKHDDGRTIVFDDHNKKVLKRFRAGDYAHNNAQRFAEDYRWAHRNDDESPLMQTLIRSGLAPQD